MDNKKGHPKAAPKHEAHFADLSAEAQRKRLIDTLRCGPITTLKARRLDIQMSAARVHELRHDYGCVIQTIRTHQPTDCGKLHSIARYTLISEGEAQ